MLASLSSTLMFVTRHATPAPRDGRAPPRPVRAAVPVRGSAMPVHRRRAGAEGAHTSAPALASTGDAARAIHRPRPPAARRLPPARPRRQRAPAPVPLAPGRAPATPAAEPPPGARLRACAGRRCLLAHAVAIVV